MALIDRAVDAYAAFKADQRTHAELLHDFAASEVRRAFAAIDVEAMQVELWRMITSPHLEPTSPRERMLAIIRRHLTAAQAPPKPAGEPIFNEWGAISSVQHQPNTSYSYTPKPADEPDAKAGANEDCNLGPSSAGPAASRQVRTFQGVPMPAERLDSAERYAAPDTTHEAAPLTEIEAAVAFYKAREEGLREALRQEQGAHWEEQGRIARLRPLVAKYCPSGLKIIDGIPREIDFSPAGDTTHEHADGYVADAGTARIPPPCSSGSADTRGGSPASTGDRQRQAGQPSAEGQPAASPPAAQGAWTQEQREAAYALAEAIFDGMPYIDPHDDDAPLVAQAANNPRFLDAIAKAAPLFVQKRSVSVDECCRVYLDHGGVIASDHTKMRRLLTHLGIEPEAT